MDHQKPLTPRNQLGGTRGTGRRARSRGPALRYVRRLVYRLGMRPSAASIFFSPSLNSQIAGIGAIQGMTAGIEAARAAWAESETGLDG